MYKNTLSPLFLSIKGCGQNFYPLLNFLLESVPLFGCLSFTECWESEWKSILKGSQVEVSSVGARLLYVHKTGSIGLANRASMPVSRVLPNKWAVLIELSSTVCIVAQGVSADTVPSCIISFQGTQATALQWLFIAVAVIKKNREGWLRSAVQWVK